jgi:cell division protein FtsZ
VLFNVIGGGDLSMTEIDEAASLIAKSVDPEADIIFGAAIDEQMVDSIRITLIATRFDESRVNLFRFKKDTRPDTTSTTYMSTISDLESSEEKPAENVKEQDMEDSDEFDIPAFLRKK